MLTVPDTLRHQLTRHGQEHVLAFWERLDDTERRVLLEQLTALDLDGLSQLYARRSEKFQPPAADSIQPVPVLPDTADEAAQRVGAEALRRGEVAVLVVAGGQGSRLGFEHPKGMYAIGPVSRNSLFRIHVEKVLALRRRHGAAVPLLVMTSPATDVETRTFFAEKGFFGLPPDDVRFFCQGTMPALDLPTGKLLLEAPGQLFLSPDGHGGSLTALHDSGQLDRLRRDGVRQLFYFQVDNPLVKIADPQFLGQHIGQRAEVSSKVVAKLGPSERMGVIVSIDGRCTIIEYSDLPPALAEQREPDGRLRLWTGSPAIHVFDVDFLSRVNRSAERIPFHLARKKVPHIDAAGRPVQPASENALKFERFIFDVLPLAERWLVVESSRREEFAPLKNAEGADSPQEVKQALSNQAADWLTRAGVRVPRRSDGAAAVPLEISPLFALDAAELAGKVGPGTVVDGPRYFAPV
jgi:UDP-N-acetylglucosamine/UDP-N-acetylgalactosamine diphosphorylase